MAQPTPSSAGPAPIAYEPSTGQPSGRRFTLLLILTLLNTCLLVAQYVRPWIADVRQWLQSRRTSPPPPTVTVASTPANAAEIGEPTVAATAPSPSPERILEAEKSLMKFRLPPRTVVYTEVPDEISELGKQGEYALFSVDTQRDRIGADFPSTWRAPVYRKMDPSPILDGVTSSGVLFCHQRASPNGYQRLVVVWIQPDMQWEVGGNGFVLSNAPHFKSELLFPSVGGAAPLCVKRQDFHSKPYDSTGVDIMEGTARKIRPNSGRFLRLFAGQPDPHDASRFTITGTLGDTEVVMKGRLMDNDTIELTPPVGNYWPSSGSSGGRRR
jgi:hypothetical protein